MLAEQLTERCKQAADAAYKSEETNDPAGKERIIYRVFLASNSEEGRIENNLSEKESPRVEAKNNRPKKIQLEESLNKQSRDFCIKIQEEKIIADGKSPKSPD